jgi:rubrerythrin
MDKPERRLRMKSNKCPTPTGKRVLKEDIAENLKEETEAKNAYHGLAKDLKTKGFKREAHTVMGIAKDESDHHRLLTNIRKKIK